MHIQRANVLAVLASLAAVPVQAAEIVVGQKGKSFTPSAVTLKVGDTLAFQNDDDTVHNVYAKAEGHAFNLKMQKPGDKFGLTMEKEGEFEARCAIHPKMVVKVTVKKK